MVCCLGEVNVSVNLCCFGRFESVSCDSCFSFFLVFVFVCCELEFGGWERHFG